MFEDNDGDFGGFANNSERVIVRVGHADAVLEDLDHCLEVGLNPNGEKEDPIREALKLAFEIPTLKDTLSQRVELV